MKSETEGSQRGTGIAQIQQHLLRIVRESSVVATLARAWTIRRLATAATAQVKQLFF